MERKFQKEINLLKNYYKNNSNAKDEEIKLLISVLSEMRSKKEEKTVSMSLETINKIFFSAFLKNKTPDLN